MDHISHILYKNKKKSSCALIPFITAGYPSVNFTFQALDALDKQGADVIELGIPYSDALADGPLIQEASKVAIQNGVNVDKVISILGEVSKRIKTPIIVFTYYNPILFKGINIFIKKISQAGAKGLIIPDLPLEEADYVVHLCEINSLELIFFISPTSSTNRILSIANKSPGCLYLVSSTGVTGLRDSVDDNINNISNNILSGSNKMIMLGFGISSPSQVKSLLYSNKNIQGIVVGSAITKIISECFQQDSDIISTLSKFCSSMKAATFE
uniref:Tryptophan synthase alpha chain n=1 Tax=Tolypiocladia glomerulata TaxID=860646 RepID=A0A1Z1MUC3_9FLOR|nr:Tryptophan synthase alpha subunit [Tolypiocladia glomerulata]ARW69683.1 Tryptophan synthase alpha subunit [Tolypiocladia glomerulata]